MHRHPNEAPEVKRPNCRTISISWSKRDRNSHDSRRPHETGLETETEWSMTNELCTNIMQMHFFQFVFDASSLKRSHTDTLRPPYLLGYCYELRHTHGATRRRPVNDDTHANVFKARAFWLFLRLVDYRYSSANWYLVFAVSLLSLSATHNNCKIIIVRLLFVLDKYRMNE